MKSNALYIPMLVILLTFIHPVASQTPDSIPPPPVPKIQMLAKHYGDSVRLRWAPEDAAVWLMLNRTGYRLYRTCYDHPTDTLKKELQAEPLKPWSLDQMKKVFGPTDTLAAIAAQMVHGKNLEVAIPEEGFESGDNMLSQLLRTQEMQQQRFAMAMQSADFSFNVAEALGLAFTDRDVEPGMFYVYGIEPVILPGMSQVKGMYLVVINDSTPAPNPAPRKPEVQQGANHIEVIWPRDFNTGFYIEKSLDGGKTYRLLNHSPFAAGIPDGRETRVTSYEAMLKIQLLKTHHIFHDGVVEGKTATYRIRGLNPFGELTPWSDTTSLYVKPLVRIAAPLVSLTETIDNRYIRLSWSYDGDTTLLAGYLVYASSSPRGDFELISPQLIPPQQKWFTDSLASRRSYNYYKVASIGMDESQNASFPVVGVLNDETPPPPPTGLKGKIYDDGTLEVTWEASKAEDIKGYRVLHANDSMHNFVPYSGYALPPTLFLTQIPLKTLSRQLYIKVIAQDLAGNMSEHSEMLILERPDVVPPTTPRIFKSEVDRGIVSMVWMASASTDVAGYYVWKREEHQEEWQLLKYVESKEVSGQFMINDQLPETGLYYLYAAEAVDHRGNSSGLSGTVSFKAPKSFTANVPIELQATFDQANFQCRLSWNCAPEGDHHYVVTRGINGEAPGDYRSVNQGVKEFTDNRIGKGMELTYSVYIIFKDGRVSQHAKPVTLKIPE